jgi:hypothetical protein
MSSVYDALTKAGKKAESAGTLAVSWQGLNLKWKIMLLVFGLLFAVIVNHLVTRVLRDQMEESAVLMTTNLSDTAAGYIASNDALRLRTTVTKYARLNRVAYVLVQDRAGKIIASSLASSNQQLLQIRSFKSVGEKSPWTGKRFTRPARRFLTGSLVARTSDFGQVQWKETFTGLCLSLSGRSPWDFLRLQSPS